MVHWVYVVECEDTHIYVGETKRLYRRFNEHINGFGSKNTERYMPEKLVGLYKVNDNFSFMLHRENIKKGEYDKYIINHWGEDDNGNLEVENHLTEMYFYLRNIEDNDDFWYDDGKWYKIRGGKYTREIIYSNPTTKLNKEDILDRPCCHCKYPCEVKLSKDRNTIYYVCALKNVWDDFTSDLEIDEPCDFFKVYNEDVYIKKQYEINEKRLKEEWVKYLPAARDKIFPTPCIKCNKKEYTPLFGFGTHRILCKDCLSNKYDELKREFSFDKCLILDDD
jgi:predicted GIY-YIG superfamily endonuclease